MLTEWKSKEDLNTWLASPLCLEVSERYATNETMGQWDSGTMGQCGIMGQWDSVGSWVDGLMGCSWCDTALASVTVS